MPYAVQGDFISQFGERETIALTDRDQLGVIAADVLEKALAGADAEIDSYLIGRYQLPLVGSFPLLRRYACDIARYLLCGAEVAEVETVRNRYKDALRFLESVRDGKVTLGASGGQPAPEPGRIAVVGGDRTFTRDSLFDFTG